jgi:hypothetical protein
MTTEGQATYEKIIEMVDELTGKMSVLDCLEVFKELDSEISIRLHLMEDGS